MRARATLILLFILVGCQAPFVSSGVVDLNLDAGVSSYTGSVNPFTIPIQLRVREVPFYEGTINSSQTSLNEPTLTTTLTFRGSIRKLGAKFVHTDAYEELVYQGERFPLDEPLWVQRRVTDELGNVEKTEITVSDVLKKLGLSGEDLDLGSSAPYGVAPLSVGDDIFEGRLGVALREAEGLGKFQVRSGTMRATAKGLTFYQGKQHLLAELGGFLDLSSGDDQATLTVNGFVLIDIDTGIQTLAHLGLTSTGRKDGKPFARELVGKLEQRPR